MLASKRSGCQRNDTAAPCCFIFKQKRSSRREDGYAERGRILASPWAGWMSRQQQRHEYGYVSVITAFPMDEDNHQGWHRDTPDGEAMDGAWHQITVMIYMTDVTASNGGTQFRRMAAGDEVVVEGPAGTVVAFLSSSCVHRGLTNREGAPRVLAYIAFDAEDEDEGEGEDGGKLDA